MYVLVAQVPYEGRTYGDLETIRVTLNAYETIKLRDTGRNDLTGTRIAASSPVAVFSGNVNTGVPNGDSFPRDNVVEQMSPITTWGRNFAVSGTPGSNSAEEYLMVAAEDNTRIRINLGAGFEDVSGVILF